MCRAFSLAVLLTLTALSPALAAKPKPAPVAYVKVPQQIYEQVLNEMIAKADDAWHHGDFETVVLMYKMVTELDPGDVESWSNRAWVLWSALNKDDEAFKVLKQGISANPKRYELYFETAQLHDHRKEFPQSVPYYRKALTLGAPAITRHALAHALEMSGKVEDAKQTWRQALKLNPRDEAARNNLERLERGEIRK